MKTSNRVLLVQAICWAVASFVGWQLYYLDAPAPETAALRTVAQRIQVKRPPRKVEAAAREQVRIETKTLPKTKPAVKTQKAVEAPLPPAPMPEDVIAPHPVMVMAFDQPGLHEPVPPAPPDDLPAPAHFDDKAGGSVVVLAMQVNSDNFVIATDILVASNNPFNDLTFAMSSRGKKLDKIDPPIPPGQTRWIEIRVDFDPKPDNSSVLP